MTAITGLHNVIEALLTEGVGPGVTLKIATEIEQEMQYGACNDFGLAAENTPHPWESACDFRSPIGMHIGHI